VIQSIVDGTDSNTGTVAMDYAQRVIADLSRAHGAQTADPSQLTVPPIELRSRAWFNADLRSRNFNVPGVIGVIVMLMSLLLTSMAIVREREIGTMEQLMVTPIRPMELIVGKTLPYIGIGFVEMLLVMALSTFWFRVPVAGSVALLFALSLVFIFTSLGLGLFISTVSHTQQQAMMTTFFFMLPSILLSGFIFPIANMPPVIQWLTHVIPLRYFLVIVRGIFLKGNGFAILWPQVAVLVVFGVAILGLSALRFRKRLG
jgi:ABC-2 type transport system permease protein